MAKPAIDLGNEIARLKNTCTKYAKQNRDFARSHYENQAMIRELENQKSQLLTENVQLLCEKAKYDKIKIFMSDRLDEFWTEIDRKMDEINETVSRFYREMSALGIGEAERGYISTRKRTYSNIDCESIISERMKMIMEPSQLSQRTKEYETEEVSSSGLVKGIFDCDDTDDVIQSSVDERDRDIAEHQYCESPDKSLTFADQVAKGDISDEEFMAIRVSQDCSPEESYEEEINSYAGAAGEEAPTEDSAEKYDDLQDTAATHGPDSQLEHSDDGECENNIQCDQFSETRGPDTAENEDSYFHENELAETHENEATETHENEADLSRGRRESTCTVESRDQHTELRNASITEQETNKKESPHKLETLPRRRRSKPVSYALPSLRKKLRRDQEKLVDAVTGSRTILSELPTNTSTRR
ncbi:hypothetical protein CANCADRAFT_46188 [Tortispora caseinolytica NRRL Y-17796]|uniref:Shugoshin C-terminal domain-containing protein n=1 Tax=Tortispora caseinolytica NRRL Y-17796 TaxID=767744 RepID=A0A1E4TDE6_9ASCO|nr:hypothetical protein CANCADRAFT_46188 [Tortispora caseinolytica NRRL Y-17796]